MSVNRDNPSVQKILDAAFTCFGRMGYHGTSLKEIAKVAGVSKALIHYHFENKETLLFELEASLHHQTFDVIQTMAEGKKPGLETALTAMDALANEMKRLAPLTPVFLELSAVVFGSPELQARSARFWKDTQKLIEIGIVTLLGPDIDRLVIPPKRLAPMLLACLQGFALAGLYSGEASTTLALDDLKELLRRSLLESDAEKALFDAATGRTSSNTTIADDRQGGEPK